MAFRPSHLSDGALNPLSRDMATIAYNQRFVFSQCKLVNCVYAQLHNTLTSASLTVKTETSSAFSIKMRIKNQSRDLNLILIEAAILKQNYKPLNCIYRHYFDINSCGGGTKINSGGA